MDPYMSIEKHVYFIISVQPPRLLKGRNHYIRKHNLHKYIYHYSTTTINIMSKRNADSTNSTLLHIRNSLSFVSILLLQTTRLFFIFTKFFCFPARKCCASEDLKSIGKNT